MWFIVVVRFGAQVERHFSYLFHLEFVSTVSLVSSFQSEFANFSLVLIENIWSFISVSATYAVAIFKKSNIKDFQ